MIVRRFHPNDTPRISRFSERLRDAGVPLSVYAEGPHDPSAAISARLFVAAADDEVRGAVWMHEHEFRMEGRTITAGWAKYPVAESLINPGFGGVAGALIVKLMREQPMLMALGMGGLHGQFARLLKSMRWLGVEVPFLARVVRPTYVLQNLRALRATAGRRLMLDFLARTGLGWLACRGHSLFRRRAVAIPSNIDVTLESHFGLWADTVWQRDRDAYSFIAVRDARMLNEMYPASMPVERLRIRRGTTEIGWVVVLRRDLRDQPTTSFGPLTVGMIVDGLCDPRDTLLLVSIADQYLESLSVDLLFSNQTNQGWLSALRRHGYIAGPSQFAFFASPRIADALRAPIASQSMQINRGDCDGPMFA